MLNTQTTAVRVRPRALVVLAGIPGAGKTTLLTRLDADEPVTILDSDQVRMWLEPRVALPYRYWRVFVHLTHRLRVFWAALFCPGLLVVHEPSTRPGTRFMLVLAGLLSGVHATSCGWTPRPRRLSTARSLGAGLCAPTRSNVTSGVVWRCVRRSSRGGCRSGSVR